MPDVIILGDSHAIAVAEGARLRGYDPAFCYRSGRAWHDFRRIRFDPVKGLTSPRKFIAEKLDALEQQLDNCSILDAGLPIIASIGYHLGNLAMPLTWNNHVPAHAGDGLEAPVMTQSFVEAYVEKLRARHIQMLWNISRRTTLVAFSPPYFGEPEAFDTIRDIMAARFAEKGILHIDARRFVAPGETSIPPELTAEDGRHGNAEYGGMIIDLLVTDGILPPPGEVQSTASDAKRPA